MITVPVPIPTPEEAAHLRALFEHNRIILDARVALLKFGGHLTLEQVAALLPMWQYYKELSPREVKAVLAYWVARAGDDS